MRSPCVVALSVLLRARSILDFDGVPGGIVGPVYSEGGVTLSEIRLNDRGVRRGTDVLEALAFGADAVLVGRPIFYGLSSGGADGVERMIGILRHELELAMALSGRASIAEIDRSVLWD